MRKAVVQRFITGFSWSQYWATHLFNESDLALKFDSRSGNTLINSKSAETATIMVEEFIGDGTVGCRSQIPRGMIRNVTIIDDND